MVRPLWPEDDRNTQAPWTKYHRWIEPGDPAYISVMQVFREYELAGIEVDDASAAIAVRLGRSRYQQIVDRRRQEDQEWAEKEEERRNAVGFTDDIEGAVVYYVRRGNFIKIGTTNRLQARMTALRPDEVLAFEPGSYALERERHHQFRETRVDAQGEYFRPTPELTRHMLGLRAKHGLPDQRLLKVTDGRRFFTEQQNLTS